MNVHLHYLGAWLPGKLLLTDLSTFCDCGGFSIMFVCPLLIMIRSGFINMHSCTMSVDSTCFAINTFPAVVLIGVTAFEANKVITQELPTIFKTFIPESMKSVESMMINFVQSLFLSGFTSVLLTDISWWLWLIVRGWNIGAFTSRISAWLGLFLPSRFNKLVWSLTYWYVCSIGFTCFNWVKLSISRNGESSTTLPVSRTSASTAATAYSWQLASSHKSASSSDFFLSVDAFILSSCSMKAACSFLITSSCSTNFYFAFDVLAFARFLVFSNVTIDADPAECCPELLVWCEATSNARWRTSSICLNSLSTTDLHLAIALEYSFEDFFGSCAW